MLQQVHDYLEKDKDNAIGRLLELLAIESVSTDPAYKPAMQQGAKWVADTLSELGLETQQLQTGGGKGHDAIIARTTDDMVMNPAAPRVLFYGHYDVQPPAPLEKWTTPPFEPTIRKTPAGRDAIYARGSSDDKGQVCCFLEALRGWKESQGKYPGPVTVLIEGEEEIGSEHLPGLIEAHKSELAADIAVISDTAMWDADTVAITYGLRGLLYFDIQLHGPNRDLHSGIYGGTIANPATILTRILGKLFDDDHHVAIPGFYDDVTPPADDERKEWANLNFDEAQFTASVGTRQSYGESGYELLERRWARPAVEVCGIYGGYEGAGAKTIIPSFAGAKVNFRLAPSQDPARTSKLFVDWLKSQPIHGLELKIEEFGRATPVVVPRTSPFIAAASKAIEAAAGKPPVLVRDGATIPVVADFKSALDVDTLLIGFGQYEDSIHAPNEKFDLYCFHLGAKTHAAVLAEIAKA